MATSTAPYKFELTYFSMDGHGNNFSMIYEFSSGAQMEHWLQQVKSLNAQMRPVASALVVNPNNTSELLKLAPWLQKCDAFIQEFGGAMVPPDLRFAINFVRQSFQHIPLIAFPPHAGTRV